MERDQVATALFAAAERRALAHGVRLGQGADHDIRSFAHKGADRIFSQYGPTPPAAAISEAEQAFAKLVDEMLSAASEIPGYRAKHPALIGEETLARALARLCPLFPIC